MKRLLLTLAAIACAFSVRAMEMWWPVAEASAAGESGAGRTGIAFFASADGTAKGGAASRPGTRLLDRPVSRIDDSFTSFAVEICNGNPQAGFSCDGPTGWSAEPGAESPQAAASPYALAAFAVPEPTGGLLMLLGLMTLGLRRRTIHIIGDATRK